MNPVVAALRDPFLARFAIRGFPAFYSLSARPSTRPINITSQIRCGVGIVNAALAVGLVGRDRPLLVVGAGAAGVAAAMAAASQHVDVWLREIEDRPFSVQASCTTRWIHPNQYDWPHEWFDEPGFPIAREPDMPLRWSADFASAIAQNWREQYDEFEPQWRNFHARFGASTIAETKDAEELAARLNVDPRTGEFTDFGAYLFCRGFSSELVRIGRYSGFGFWQSDPFDQPNLGLERNNPAHVLISGAGDGGLQDLLRVSFAGKRPIELLVWISEAISRTADARKWQAFCEAMRLLQPALDKAPRISGPKDPCLQFVRSLAPSTMNAVFDTLRSEVTFDFERGSLQLINPGSFLPDAFALNRFIVRLLERLLADQFRVQRPLIRSGVKIADIDGARGHVCANKPSECHGRSHRCRIGSDSETFNVLIVRHGLAREARLLERAATPASA